VTFPAVGTSCSTDEYGRACARSLSVVWTQAVPSLSLTNMFSETSGDTPLLACLRHCGKNLRWMADQTANKASEHALLELLATARALVNHPFIDPFIRGRTSVSTVFGVALPGGGASALLFLLIAADKADALGQQLELTSDRRSVVTEASEQINALLLALVDRVEPGEQLQALQDDLVRAHDPSVWRDFGGATGKALCLDLMLRSRRRQLVTYVCADRTHGCRGTADGEH
jgi:hypothetical protein